ncbi:Apoptogenic protein 1, mitochondrial [Halocaridina rubra]|uniref:Apoptogenic protein 1, mitochondrial n=1 Tax=Halocaridina rubra TaxID=373956 RepID=A0AAN9A1W5_HALRR
MMLRLPYTKVTTLHVPGRNLGTAVSVYAHHKTKRKETSDSPDIDPQKEKCDCIGPPDPLSNIRVYKYYVPPDETDLECRYRIARTETQEWNQKFWTHHNSKFKKMKEEFIQKKLREKYGDDLNMRKTLSAEEMSQFYKRFLDDHRHIHMEYNKEWYRRNFHDLYLAAKVWLEQKLKTRR